MRDVANEFAGKVKVSIEEYGNSPMATKFGVRRYPVVFVDDVLVARPKDFGFGGAEDVSGGLYVPWLDPANQRKFKDDLRRTVVRRLSGERVAGLDVADVATESDASEGAPTMPALALQDISGKTIDAARLSNRPVIVELWATWCPPCRSTMAWLPSLQKKYGDRATVLAIAVDSKPDDVRKMPVVQRIPDRDGHAGSDPSVRRRRRRSEGDRLRRAGTTLEGALRCASRSPRPNRSGGKEGGRGALTPSCVDPNK